MQGKTMCDFWQRHTTSGGINSKYYVHQVLVEVAAETKVIPRF